MKEWMMRILEKGRVKFFEETTMFFILERKEGNRFNQLGIVVAASIEEAAAKIEMKIVEAVHPPESAIQFANLENSYCLSEMPEINSPSQIAEPKETASPLCKRRKRVRKKTALPLSYSPKAILLGSKEFDITETSKKIVEAYCELSTEFRPASWEQVAEKLDLTKDKNTRAKIIGTLNLVAGAYRDLYKQPHPYIVRKPEE